MPKSKSFTDMVEDSLGEATPDIIITSDSKVESISTGALSLDAAIGVGGVPRGRYTVVAGPEGSGKSTLALSVARNAIKSNIRVLYVDVENQMHTEYMELLLGESLIDGGNFVLAKPKTSDQVFNIMEAGIRSKEFGLIILDSVAALSPVEEQEKEFEKATVAIISKDLPKFFRRNSFDVRKNNIAVLFINQVRDTIGSYVPILSMPGGHALKHYVSVTIWLSKGQDIKAGDEVIGILTKFNIKKNKLAPPFRSFLIPIIFGKGIDTMRDVVEYATTLGIIRKGGPYYKFEDITLGKGMLDTMEYLTNNKPILDKITETCYNIVGKYKHEITEETEDTDG